MTKRLRAAVLCAGLAMSLNCGYLSAAQQTKHVPPALISQQILEAKKVFIANGGGDESLFGSPQYSGGADRLYNEFTGCALALQGRRSGWRGLILRVFISRLS